MRNYGANRLEIRLPEILYHATTSNNIESIKNRIDLNECSEKTDFGQGFYLTTNVEQAVKWALRKEGLHNKHETLRQKSKTPNFVKGVVIEYEVIHKVLNELRQKNFIHQSADWADFIYLNRSSLPTIEKLQKIGVLGLGRAFIDDDAMPRYDIIKGPLGDGQSIFQETHIRDNSPSLDSQVYLAGIKSKSREFSSYDQVSLHTTKALRLIKYRKVVVASELLRSGMESNIHSKGD
ncbi:DUF3990 domain-containing protein [Bacillus velezensis]|uniref:DUF3990 domain-containing protein n=1 Tax=Bacillus velezensis TaxID=492670 RepID=UPI002E22A065|nr:DUF3990 domain-containing protein [Bacillus velezensis]